MRNVFTDGCEKSAVPWKIIVPALCFLAVFVTVLLGTAGIGRRTREQGRATAEEAVRRAAVRAMPSKGATRGTRHIWKSITGLFWIRSNIPAI